jgi:transposase-like protein
LGGAILKRRGAETPRTQRKKNEVRENSGPRNKEISDHECSDQKRYTAEFKAQAVGLVGLGKPVSDVRRLRRENTQLKLENDILKKAAVILGTKPQPGDER